MSPYDGKEITVADIDAAINDLKHLTDLDGKSTDELTKKIKSMIESSQVVCKTGTGATEVAFTADAGLFNDVLSDGTVVWLLPGNDYVFTNMFAVSVSGSHDSEGSAGWVNSDPKDGRMYVWALAKWSFGTATTRVNSVIAIKESFVPLLTAISRHGIMKGDK